MENYDYSDVTPANLNVEEPQLCQILYDERYKKVMGTLLGLLASKEYSERALALTKTGIDLLASHYTIWNYRYNILLHINGDLFKELDWCEELALENEKNYQIWNYRQLIIAKIITDHGEYNPHREYAILDSMLEQDSKNHHVWSYRKWLVEKFNLFDDERELAFVEKCILEDLRNNSAWTHRYFLKFSTNTIPNEAIEQEIEYCKDLIKQSPQNPSSWNYLIGIYNKYHRKFSELKEFCQQLNRNNEYSDEIYSSYALEILAKIHVENCDIDEAKRLYTLLRDTYDPIRKNYWQYQIQKL